MIRGAVLLAALWTVYLVYRCYSPLPKWDQWVEVRWMKNYYAGQWRLSDLWRQHNEHRILFPRLFLWTDLFLFKGKNIFLFISIFALQAVHCRIFLRCIKREKGISPGEHLFLWSVFIVLFFSACQLENFTWGFQISFILVFLAGTLSIDRLLEFASRQKATPPARAPQALLASIAAATMATYSLASGILIWPTLLLVGIVLRLRRSLAIIAAAGALNLLLYFNGYHKVPEHTDVPFALHQPLQMLFYAAAYIALPVTRLHHGVGIGVGLVQILFTAWMLVRLLSGHLPFTRLLLLTLGNMSFVIATALVTAAGRMTLGTPEGALRYATPALIFWACFITVCLLERNGLRWGARDRLAIVASAATTWFVLAVVPLSISEAARFNKLTPVIAEAGTALLVNIHDAARVRIIFPLPDVVFDLAGFLRAHQLSIFSDTSAEALGKRLTDAYLVADSSACRGAIEFTEPLADAPGTALTGWAWDNTGNRTPDRVLLVSAGTIHGDGRFTRSRPDVSRAFGNSRMDWSGWFGYMQPIGAGQAYTAYAVLAGGRSVCPLTGAAALKRPSLAVFRGDDTWYIGLMDGAGIKQTRVFHFGLPGDKPVAGDWDGTGVVRAGVFRNGHWFLDWNNNGTWDEGDRQFDFGLPGDIPIVGDWDGSGKSKIGVFRKGTWILDWNGNYSSDAGDRIETFGLPGDVPVVGDWDGTGKQRIGVFRSAVWYLDMNGDFRFDGRDELVPFGLAGDYPVTGDWSGLRQHKLGVFRAGQWLIDYNGNRQWDDEDKMFSFGLPGDQALTW